MTDMIGAINIDELVESTTYRYGTRTASFTVRCTTRTLFDQIVELYRKTLGNTAIIILIGEQAEAVDKTAESVLTQYCIFDSSKSKTGWYVLTSLNYVSSQYITDYPIGVSMFFLGTDSLLQRGYDILDLEDEDNDWE